jgi:signal transduction histidine kinase
VLGGVLAAVFLFTRVTVRRELDQFLERQDGAQSAAAIASLDAYYREHDSWDGVAPLLARILAEEHRRTLIIGSRGTKGEVLARHPPELDAWTVTPRPEGGLELARRSAGSEERLVLRGPLARLPGGDVYLLPEPGAPGVRLGGTLDRWLLAGLAAALLASLALTASVVRRVLAPVSVLTAGARALATGRLDARVPVDRGDELGELASSFNSMAEALERNEAARRDLVSDVAHELRTPLASARARLEAAEDGLLPTDAKFVASLIEDVGALSRLVDDLQQLSLAQAGALRLEPVHVSLSETIARVLEGALPEAQGRGLRLRAEAPSPVTATADRDRVDQIVRNLVANALVHARSEVVVSARESGGRAELRVADDGPGVPPEAAPRIFDRFFRADASRSRATGGAGLGLAIARQLAGLMGGTLVLENRPGEGATFVLSLPAS